MQSVNLLINVCACVCARVFFPSLPRRVHANPEKPQEIDFAAYKNLVKNKAAIEQLEKAYKSLSVSYPPDTVSSQIDAQEQQTRIEGKKFSESLDSRIKEAEELVRLYFV